ncbi:hypothetical protein [Pseudomonas aeruginosa]|uniref:hypothetical protein n=1 Tax=Pseudomonas aeruginosa TaxID=287 RepID=UPI001051E270|nr:hypothetical protein [Pseudomonas aeruginosa]
MRLKKQFSARDITTRVEEVKKAISEIIKKQHIKESVRIIGIGESKTSRLSSVKHTLFIQKYMKEYIHKIGYDTDLTKRTNYIDYNLVIKIDDLLENLGYAGLDLDSITKYKQINKYMNEKDIADYRNDFEFTVNVLPDIEEKLSKII